MRFVVCIALLCLLTLAAAPTAEAHKLYEGEAKRLTKRYAKRDFYPARIYVQYCTRLSDHGIRCRMLAFYDDGYCSGYYRSQLRGNTILVSRPLLVRC